MLTLGERFSRLAMLGDMPLEDPGRGLASPTEGVGRSLEGLPLCLASNRVASKERGRTASVAESKKVADLLVPVSDERLRCPLADQGVSLL